MKFILQLSGEHPSLPLAELKAVLDGELLDYDIDLRGRLAFVEIDDEGTDFISRLAYTLQASEEVAEAASVDGLAADIYEAISESASFRVTGPMEVQKRLGDLLHRFGLEVDLGNPDSEVVVYENRGRYVAGIKVKVERRYAQRRAQYRPYFHPTSMHPKLARALVNLTRVCEGESLLDPFCGTGGILIEAGMMGVGLHGWDIDPKMAEGCRQNLKEYGLKGDIEVRDALEGRLRVDAIATDPPYGRSSYTSEEVGSLLRKFVANARTMLDEGCYMALMTPAEQKVEAAGFEVRETFDVYIHKSLTRRAWVLEAI